MNFWAIIAVILVVLLLIFHNTLNFGLNTAIVITIFVVVLILMINRNQTVLEGIDMSDIDALRDMASAYTSGNITVQNFTVTDTLKVGNSVKFTANGHNRIQLYKNGDSNGPYLSFNADGVTEYNDGTSQIWTVDENGNINVNNINTQGPLVVGSTVTINSDPTLDRIQVYKNADRKPPYTLFGSAGDVGAWDGTTRTWTINNIGDITNKNGILYGDPESKDKFRFYVNGDSRAPYLYFNKDARFGLYADPGGDVWRAEGHTACDPSRGAMDGAFYAHHTCPPSWNS
jgi:hypothetical protein